LLDPGQELGVVRAAGQAWALGLLARKGGGPHLVDPVGIAVRDARSAPISPAAFPAVAYAAFAPLYARRREPSDFTKRLRITWAVARGRI
ncbi:MAG: hypothetical protein ABW042_01375, partial [Phenylobacterium sp.]